MTSPASLQEDALPGAQLDVSKTLPQVLQCRPSGVLVKTSAELPSLSSLQLKHSGF